MQFALLVLAATCVVPGLRAGAIAREWSAVERVGVTLALGLGLLRARCCLFPAGAATDLGIEYRRPAAAFRGFFVALLAIGHVVIPAYGVGQTAIYQFVGAAAKVFAPRAVLDLGLENLFQAETREIFRP
jgi:hypothetical protein